jgi:hypothetical protein
MPASNHMAPTSAARRQLVEAHPLGARAEHEPPLPRVRARELDLAVEPARPHQRRVERVRAVGGHDHAHAVVLAAAVEPVHLRQQLDEHALRLAIGGLGRPHRGHRIRLVDEHDRGRPGPREAERVAHHAGALAEEPAREVRTAEAEERRLGVARDGPGQHGLPRAGRSAQEHAARGLHAQPREQNRVRQRQLEGLPDLAHLLLAPGHIVVRHARPVLVREEEGLRGGAAGVRGQHAGDLAARSPRARGARGPRCCRRARAGCNTSRGRSRRRGPRRRPRPGGRPRGAGWLRGAASRVSPSRRTAPRAGARPSLPAFPPPVYPGRRVPVPGSGSTPAGPRPRRCRCRGPSCTPHRPATLLARRWRWVKAGVLVRARQRLVQCYSGGSHGCPIEFLDMMYLAEEFVVLAR